MPTFTMPTLPGLRDPVVFPKRDGIDYMARADEAWRQIEANLTALSTVSDRLLRTSLRVQEGHGWLHDNVGHAQYDEAYRTLRELENEVVNLGINIRSLEKVIWNECCTLYAALHHTNRDKWLADNGASFGALSPEGIWQAVCPRREQPGSWPPSEKDHYYERKLNYEGWRLASDALTGAGLE
jgi:hypothetical protein